MAVGNERPELDVVNEVARAAGHSIVGMDISILHSL